MGQKILNQEGLDQQFLELIKEVRKAKEPRMIWMCTVELYAIMMALERMD